MARRLRQGGGDGRRRRRRLRGRAIDRARRLKDAFEKLTPQQKTALELAYYEGLSQTEMADRLKQPLGTVKTWVRTALKHLRDQLNEAAVA